MYMCLIAYLYIYISNEMEREKTENKEIRPSSFTQTRYCMKYKENMNGNVNLLQHKRWM